MSQQLPVAYDQYGQPFVIIREQDKKKRLKGLDAQRVISIFSHL